MVKDFMRQVQASSRFAVCVFLMLASIVSVGARQYSPSTAQSWETYSDERFDFQIDYPKGWYILPRDDSESSVGATLSFSNLPFPTEDRQDARTNNRVVVTVGFYLAEIQPGEPISQWAMKYEEKARIEDPSHISVIENSSVIVSQRSSWRYRGRAGLGAFNVVMVPVEKIVWFVWSNAEKRDLGIYNHIVASFKVGGKAPKSLNEVYGPAFNPVSIMSSNQSPLKIVAGLQDQSGVARNHLASFALVSDPVGYRLPFTGKKTITQGPGCGFSHTGRLFEAIDYGLSTGTAVKATYAGVSSFVGWSNQGYGNLINIDHSPSPVKRSYYGHLDRFAISGVGKSVSKGQIIGYSGNSGNSTGPHLHFEVRDVASNNSIWIRTLPTTVWYSGNPNSPCTGSGTDPDGYATGP